MYYELYTFNFSNGCNFRLEGQIFNPKSTLENFQKAEHDNENDFGHQIGPFLIFCHVRTYKHSVF